MQTSLSPTELAAYLCAQINHFFPDGRTIRPAAIARAIDTALQRTDYCFAHSALPHYCTESGSIFNHLHSDQYAVLLWFVANSLWQVAGRIPAVDKLYYLNKALHGLDCMYNTQLPDIFFLQHCVGAVLGKATYANFFVASQGCTVGSHNGNYPVLGMGVALAAHASVIGGCTIGERVSIGSMTGVFRQDVPDDTAVYRDRDGAIIHRPSQLPYAQRFFSVDLHGPHAALPALRIER